jgi:translocation and assembly module TamB
MLAGIALLLYSEPGRNLLARYIEGALSTPGEFEVELGRLHGPLPARILIDRIEIADSNGTWMTVRNLELGWSPFELLGARLRVDSMRAGEIAILRRPVRPETPAPGTEAPASLSLPPVEIDLDSMTVDALRLEEPVLGQPADLKLGASAAALRDRATARLMVERVDGKPGLARAALDWDAATGSLDIDAVLSEPADGLVARLLDLPGRPALDLSVTGDGPAGDWQGRMELEAGALLSFGSSLSISIGRDIRLAMQGDAAPGEPLGPEIMAVLGPRTAFDLEAGRAGGTRDWKVTVKELTSAGVTARGMANVNATEWQIDGKLEIETLDAGRLAGFVRPASFGSAKAAIEFEGPLMNPFVRLNGALATLAVEGFSAEHLDLQAELRPDRPLNARDARIAINGEMRFAGLKTPSPELDTLLGRNPVVGIDGAELDSYSRLALGKVTVSGDKAEASLAGGMALDSGQLDASGQVAISDLAPLSGAAGRTLGGRVETNFVLAREADGAIDLVLDGALRDASLDQPIVERLLGPNAAFSGKARRRPDGQLSLSELSLSGKGMEAKGQMTIPAGATRLEAGYDIAVSDLEALGIADPLRTDGRLEIAGKATGPVDNPVLDGNLRLVAAAPGGFPVKRLGAKFTISNPATDPRGEIRLDGETALFPDVEGQTGFLLSENILTLSGLHLSARGASADGALTVPLDGRAVAGDLRLRAPDIAPWSDIVGRQLSGALDGRVGLRGEGKRQDAVLDITVSNVSLDGQVSARRIDLDMRVADLAGDPGLKGAVTASDLRGGPAAIRDATLTLDGSMRDLAYKLHAAGKVRDRDIGLDAAGTLRRSGERTTLSVASLSGTAAGIPVRLARPALLEIDPALDSGDIELAIGDGKLRGHYRQAGGRVSMLAETNAIPLASLWPAAPPQLDEAVIDARLSLDGPVGDPAGRLALAVSGLAAGETEEVKEGLTLAVNAELGGGSLAASGSVRGLAGVDASMEAKLPARLSLAPVGFTIDENTPLTGRVAYLGPVGPGWALMGLDRHKLEGKGDVAVAISGTVRDPRISGRIELADGRYENFDTGTILSDIQVSARPSNSSITIDNATAKDDGEGEVSLAGGVSFGGGELLAMDLEAEFRKARLVRRDELNAVTSGKVTLRGGASRRQVGGRLVIDEAEIRLVGGRPAGIVEIPVEETGTPPANAAKAPPPAKPSRTDLDLEISMPKRVFVRGRGLDSEWGGELKVTGTASSPRVQGTLRPLRGRYDFAGKIFTLREGSIAFAGKDEIDPALDLSAERPATDITAIIHVAGTAKHPEVTLKSIPDYPQDEVLSRVLFNKSTGRLSAGEALQLAQAVGTLTGASDGGGIMDFARGMLRLDVLRFAEQTEDTEGGAEAGKYINDRVYLGVEGTASGETGVTVEIEITPRLKLESDVGTGDKNKTGLKWKRDY